MAVTSDGVPVRCWTFPGNTADTSIIRTVKDDLAGWNLHRMVWVADRGFASAANRAYLTRGGGHYIHAEKLRNTNSEAAAALARPGRYRSVAGNLRVKEVAVAPGGNGDGDQGARAQRFVVCHNPEQADRDEAVRGRLVAHLEQLMAGSDGWTERRRDEFVGSLKSKPGLRRYLRRTNTGLLRVDAAAIKREQHLDGKWLLRTSDSTLTPDDLAAAYKTLLQVERGWRDMKGALGLRPVFHYREDRVRAHVQLCWLALLLMRVVENATDDTWRNVRHELDRMHLITLATADGHVAQRSGTTAGQKTILAALGLDEPARFFDFTIPPPDPPGRATRTGSGMYSNTTSSSRFGVSAGQQHDHDDRVLTIRGSPGRRPAPRPESSQELPENPTSASPDVAAEPCGGQGLTGGTLGRLPSGPPTRRLRRCR